MMTLYTDLLHQGQAEARSLVTVERTETRAIVTLAEPERLNPLSAGLVLQLQAVLAELAIDPALRVVVLTGADPAFSAGGDLKMIEEGSNSIRDANEQSDTTDAWRWIRRQFRGRSENDHIDRQGLCCRHKRASRRCRTCLRSSL